MKKLLSKLYLFLASLLFLILPTSSVLAVGATLSLSPASGTFNQSCTFTLAINLDTGGAKTDGTDAIINYDAARFSVSAVRAGTIYQDYPTTDFSTAGTVKVSGLASIGSTYSGSGILANIDFKVLPAAPTDSATQVKFDFDPNNKGKTTDSNVAEHGTVAEILNQVVNGSYNIGTAGFCPTTASSSAVPANIGGPESDTPTPTPKVLSTTGSEGETIALALVGGSLLILGILGLALL